MCGDSGNRRWLVSDSIHPTLHLFFLEEDYQVAFNVMTLRVFGTPSQIPIEMYDKIVVEPLNSVGHSVRLYIKAPEWSGFPEISELNET